MVISHLLMGVEKGILRGVGIGCCADEATWACPRKKMAYVIGACPPKLTAWSPLQRQTHNIPEDRACCQTLQLDQGSSLCLYSRNLNSVPHSLLPTYTHSCTHTHTHTCRDTYEDTLSYIHMHMQLLTFF